MDNDFRTRKVKFFIIERKNLVVPKIIHNLDDSYDMYDVEKRLWRELSNRATDDYGYMNRKTPKVQLGWSHLITDGENHFKFDVHKLNDVINEVQSISKSNTFTPFLRLSDIIKDSLPHYFNGEENNLEEENNEIYREKVLVDNYGINENVLDESLEKVNDEQSNDIVVTKYDTKANNTNKESTDGDNNIVPSKNKLVSNVKKIEKII